jgi:Protein of unknown function (DUF3168)
MLVETLFSVLSNDPGMQTLLGTKTSRSDSSTGIFPTQAPDQPSMPYLILSQVSGEPLQTSMDGTGCLTTERWRLSACGTTYKSAKLLAKIVRGLLISLNGSQAVGENTIQGAWVKLEADDSEALGKGTMYQSHVDIEFNYQDFDS